MQEIGKYVMIVGGIIILVGLIIFFAGDKMSWFGNLPGDIKVKKENFSFYIPTTSMILVSVILSALLWLIRKVL